MEKIDEKTQFTINRVAKLKQLYADEQSRRRRQDQNPSYSSTSYSDAAAVRTAIANAISSVNTISEASKKLYAINPIYANIIDYLSNMFTWQYKVTPHKVYSAGKNSKGNFEEIYNTMLEVIDGLHIESKFPLILTLLNMQGAVYFTTYSDEETLNIDTLLLPVKYCRKIAETQYGTAIIQFDFSYFDDLGMSQDELKNYMKNFPKEFTSKYNKYKSNSDERWSELDPHFSSGLMLNEIGMPNYYYAYGGILDYEQYQDNELARNENQLRYIVVHTMPHYEDNLIFEVDEVDAIHKSLKKIIETNDYAKLITTYGDVHVEKVSENDTAENQVLSKAYNTIFNIAGLNNTIFAGNSVDALNKSILKDKTMMWKYVKSLCTFYNIAVNNWYDFGGYEADVDILPISPYTYSDDMEVYKLNATLGVGKLDYIIAAGIKQRNIQDNFELEQFLQLDKITPMQTSYTQTAEDRSAEDSNKTDSEETKETDENSEKSEIEPSDNKKEAAAK